MVMNFPFLFFNFHLLNPPSTFLLPPMAADSHSHSIAIQFPIKPSSISQQFHKQHNQVSQAPNFNSVMLCNSPISKMENQSLWISASNMIYMILIGSICRFIQKFISESNCFLKSLIPLSGAGIDKAAQPSPVSGDIDELSILMEKMGLPCEQGGEEVTIGQVSRIFEDREPSIEELRAAFDVFDQNRDGFIDALELKRVVEILGLGKGCDLGDFQRMIRAFDDDRDGRIGADEFFNLMRRTLC